MEMQIQRMDLWTRWEQKRRGRMEKVVSAYIHYQGCGGQLVRRCCVADGAPSGLCDDLGGWDGEGREVWVRRVIRADSRCCLAETSTTL